MLLAAGSQPLALAQFGCATRGRTFRDSTGAIDVSLGAYPNCPLAEAHSTRSISPSNGPFALSETSARSSRRDQGFPHTSFDRHAAQRCFRPCVGVELRSPLMEKTVLPPHLVALNGVKRCSACGHAFDAKKEFSLSAAFKKHVQEVHRTTVAPKQTSS